MAFPKRLLSEGEELVIDSRPHWIALFWPAAETLVFAAAVVAILVYVPDSWPAWVRWAAVVAGLVAFVAWPLPALIRWATSHFVVTTDRLVHRSGWFAKRSMEVPLENINDVRFGQTVFERMIGAGDLIVESAGEHGQEVFSDIRKPEAVQKTIYEMSELNNRRMRGAAGPASVADELAKLQRLREDGVLSEPEFEQQKSKLLGS